MEIFCIKKKKEKICSIIWWNSTVQDFMVSYAPVEQSILSTCSSSSLFRKAFKHRLSQWDWSAYLNVLLKWALWMPYRYWWIIVHGGPYCTFLCKSGKYMRGMDRKQRLLAFYTNFSQTVCWLHSLSRRGGMASKNSSEVNIEGVSAPTQHSSWPLDSP